MTLLLSIGSSFVFGLVITWAVRSYLDTPVSIIGDWFVLRHAENPGIAFGVRIPSPWQEILIFGALVLVAFIAVKSVTRFSRFAYGLIIGGALANVFDRFSDGMVTDYFSVGTFPIFNVPDSCITIGVTLLLVESIGIFHFGKVKS
jgi:signal peptidase II